MNRKDLAAVHPECKPSCGSCDVVSIPVMRIRMMTDEEWNRLAYRNRLERQESSTTERRKISKNQERT